MKHRITKKQHNSKKCLVCGLKNDLGLQASFYELENGELVAIFKPLEEHQSYPERLHGGVAAAILDETMGRAIMISDQGAWGVTVELNIKYKKPIPLDQELRVVGRITKDSSRLFEGTGEIILPNGDIAAIGSGKYMKMPIDKIANFDNDEQEWQTLASPEDPTEIEY